MSKLFGRVSVRIGLTVGLVLLLALVAQLLVGGMLIEHATRPVRDRSVENGLRLIELAFSHGALDGSALQRHFGRNEDQVLAVYDRHGRLLARSREQEPIPERLSRTLLARARAANGRFVYITEPRVGHETAALLRVERDGTPYYLSLFDRFTPQRIAQVREQALLLAFATMGVFGLGFGALLARHIRKRVLEIQSTVRRLSNGDLSARLPTRGDDELGQLLRDVDGMALSLSTTFEHLQREQSQRRRMLADLSHELHTPLTNIVAYLESLGMSEIDSDPSTRSRYLGIVQQQSGALAALIDDLRTLSRLECEGLPLLRVPLDLAELVSHELDAARRRAEASGVSLESVAPAASVWVDGDGARLGQVLRNLLDNAIRHSPGGCAVRVELVARGPEVALSVRDHGAGIAPEHMPHLAERFYRVDASRTRATGGRGLGLAIARAIVQAHGGRLAIESVLDQGTCVRVELPAC